jgi:integrase
MAGQHLSTESGFPDSCENTRIKRQLNAIGKGKTLGSVLAQNGVSTAVIQRHLEHSSPDLTNKVYTNVDPVLRHAIDTMPAEDWLRIRIVDKKGKNV